MRRLLLVAPIAASGAVLFSCRPAAVESESGQLGPNAGCYVCHMTFLREPLSATHVKAKVSCVRCHGPSAAHANDEDVGATPPDVTFKRPQVNVFCRTCHPTHDVPPEKLLLRWQQRSAATPATRPAVPAATCTECHGRHKIARPQSQPSAAGGAT